MKSSNEIKELAFEWATDYKPWQEDLEYREYARYGYEAGYERALEDMKRFLKPPVFNNPFSD